MRVISRLALAVIPLLAAACVADQRSPRFSALAGPAREGDVGTLRRMLGAGADPNMTDPGGNGWTPLLHAIHKQQPAVVDLLLTAGASPRAVGRGMDPLLMAVGTGNAAIVTRLLTAGADPRDPEILLTAISGGALSDLDNPLLGRCNTDVVRALLARAPDLRLRRGPRARLAMGFARFNGCRDVLQLARGL